VGDGIVDDTEALQTSINWAYNNKIGIVYMPKGKYNISKPL
jgi:polygalacturonase